MWGLPKGRMTSKPEVNFPIADKPGVDRISPFLDTFRFADIHVS